MSSSSNSQHSTRPSSTNETNQSSSTMNRISPDDGGGPRSLDRDNKCTRCSMYRCSICLETATDAVLSMCGHLFCWECLAQWMYAPDSNTQIHYTCPVCEVRISREEVIPVYGTGSNKQHPRDQIPPRPSGKRTEAPPQPNHFPHGNVWAMGGPGAQIFGFGDAGFHMSFGIGSLPHYVYAIMQDLYRTNNEGRNDLEFTLMKFFLLCGFLITLFTVCYL